jgi:CheY-like chemotaxis protein
VAGLATDGAQALDTARQVNPDLIVLDINMPGLDGFQTKRALDQGGSQAPVVFLSAASSDDLVIEAFRCGGRGYVVKSRVARDLPGALDHVLRGRRFVPSLTALFEVVNEADHALQLHRNLEDFLDDLAVFFDLSLRRGDATCVIATEDVRDGLGRRLRAAGWDVGGPSGDTGCLMMDAADIVRRLLRNGMPDTAVIAEIGSELDQYRREAGEGPSSRLTLFGNVAGSLIADGNPAAAIAVERQWNALTRGLPIFTLCGYPTSCFNDRVAELWSSTCQEHSVVSHTRDV